MVEKGLSLEERWESEESEESSPSIVTMWVTTRYLVGMWERKRVWRKSEGREM